MGKRLLDYTPAELANLTKKDLVDGIRAAEGRTVCAFVCPRAVNLVEKVSNIELAASFGADLINLEGLDPNKLQICGLQSKNPADDQPYKRDLQAEMGFGWTVKELKKLIGRPIGVTLLVSEFEGQNMGPLYSDVCYSAKMMEHIVKEGYDFVSLCAIQSERNDTLIKAVKEARDMCGDRIAIETGVQHGPGSITNSTWPPFNLREVATPEYLAELAGAGADIVDVPAAGIVPGFSMEYVSKLIDAIHAAGSIAASSIAHSIESADDKTISNLIVNNKMCGADLFNVAAGGLFESMALPEALQAYCIAAKGRRHTYRRMCQSPLR